MRDANNSVQYYFGGPQEREREVAACGSEHGSEGDVDLFWEVFQELRMGNGMIRGFTQARDWDATDVDFRLVVDDEDGVRACRVDVCSVLERPQYRILSVREVIVFKRDTATGQQQAMRMDALHHELYETLTYPMLFPKGECGWHAALQKRLTLLEYGKAMLLCLDEWEGNGTLTYTSRLQIMPWLGQQYALDMFCRLEEQRLCFQKKNQALITRGRAGALS